MTVPGAVLGPLGGLECVDMCEVGACALWENCEQDGESANLGEFTFQEDVGRRPHSRKQIDTGIPKSDGTSEDSKKVMGG